MKRRSSVLVALLFIFLSIFCICRANLKMRGNSSFIKVSSGATFVAEQPIVSFGGALIRDLGGTISGENISFNGGFLCDIENDLLLNAVFKPSTNEIILSGNKLEAKNGILKQSVIVTGINNLLVGQPIFDNDIVLQDQNTTLSLAVRSAITKNIVLNEGTVYLDDDVKFAGSNIFTGAGYIQGKNRKVSTGDKPFTWSATITWQDGSNLELHTKIDLTGVLCFRGDCTINGHGNVIDLSKGER